MIQLGLNIFLNFADVNSVVCFLALKELIFLCQNSSALNAVTQF